MNIRDAHIYVIGYYIDEFIVMLNYSHCQNDCLHLIKDKNLFMLMTALNNILNIICDPFVIHLCTCVNIPCAYMRLYYISSKK